MSTNDIRFDKLEVAAIKLSDAICGFFDGNHPVTTICEASLISGLLQEIHHSFSSRGLIDSIPLASAHRHSDPLLAKLNKHLRNIMNFGKHAKSDLKKQGVIQPWQAVVALKSAAIDYSNLSDDLIGAGLATHDWDDLLQTELGDGTRTMILINTLNQFIDDFKLDDRAKTSFERVRGWDDDEEGYFSDMNELILEAFSELIRENKLRKHNPGLAEIRLTNPTESAALRLDPYNL